MGWGVHDYPEPPEPKAFICPECGEECDTLYFKRNEIIGCDNCITEVDANFYLEELLNVQP